MKFKPIIRFKIICAALAVCLMGVMGAMGAMGANQLLAPITPIAPITLITLIEEKMMQNQIRKILFAFALFALCAAGASRLATSPVAGQTQTLHGAAALERLKRDGQYDSLQTALEQARLTVSRSEASPLGRAAWHAPNEAAGYDAYVTEAGVSIAINNESPVSLHLRSLGYGAALQAVTPGDINGDQQSITIKRDNLREWFVNTPDGLEHGFTLEQPPNSALRTPHSALPLRLALAVGAGWEAVAADDQQSVTLRNGHDVALDYGKLVVRDARGLNVAARLTVVDHQVVIEADDGAAVYPLTIDPLFTLQQRLLANDSAAQDRLGWSVALSGDTAMLGAPYDDDAKGADQGAAYVFTRNGAVWTFQQKLLANDGAANQQFGFSVALDGDTALVSALFGSGAASANQGAVYVFTRNGANWTLQQKLNANDGASGETFGGAVALDGDTALIGARVHRVGNTIGQGAAYVFARNGTTQNGTWTLQQQLLASDGAELDQFGAAVALDGDTAFIGAPFADVRGKLDQGAAYVFTRSGARWTQAPKLTDSNGAAGDQFGSAVAVGGDKALIGAPRRGNYSPGAVLDFRRSAAGWQETNWLLPPDFVANGNFGVSVALDGDLALIGSSIGLAASGYDQRSAYVFRFEIQWQPVKRLGPGLGTANDRFGYAVALDGRTALVGAYQSDGAFTDQGAAYTFVIHDGQHLEQQYLTDERGKAADHFGEAVALDGDTLAVGVPQSDLYNDEDGGVVRVFRRTGASWALETTLRGTPNLPRERFGSAVALKGDTLAVGAPGSTIGSTARQGSVFVFVRNGVNWTRQRQIIANDGAANDGFGWAVALDGERLAAGAPYDDDRALDQGSAYVFERSGTNWTQQAKLYANAPEPDDRFGSAVALEANTLAVGAPRESSTSQRPQTGTVFVFTREGAQWSAPKRLFAKGELGREHFGTALALRGDTLVIGAPLKNANRVEQHGAAYVFTRRGVDWTEQEPSLTVNRGLGEGVFNFGYAVALGGERLVIGAQGAAYVFEQRNGYWFYQQRLTTRAGAHDPQFSAGIAFQQDTIAVGWPRDTVGGNISQGSVSVFVSPLCQPVKFNLTTLPNAEQGAAYHQPLTATGSGAEDTFRFALSAGVLPPGLTLDVRGVLQGTPGAAGIYRFTLTATNNVTYCAGRLMFTLTITPPCGSLTLAPASLPSGRQQAAYQQSLTVAGGVAPYSFAVTAGVLPAGLNLSGSGTLSGTPTTARDESFTITATGANGCTAQRTYTLKVNSSALALVSAASYQPGAAPEAMVAVFGAEISAATQAANALPLPTQLANVSARVRDSQGTERLAPLFFVSPGQINLLMPAGTALGVATVTLTNGASGTVEVTRTAGGLFAANANGQGVPAAVLLRIRGDGSQSYESVARFDGNSFVPVTIDFGPLTDQLVLVLYGTGIRARQQINAKAGLYDANVLYAGELPGFAGLDQINVLLPRILAGTNGSELVWLTVDGKQTNTLIVKIK
jgi:uncharacterized protein (TIGR03437 family)